MYAQQFLTFLSFLVDSPVPASESWEDPTSLDVPAEQSVIPVRMKLEFVRKDGKVQELDINEVRTFQGQEAYMFCQTLRYLFWLLFIEKTKLLHQVEGKPCFGYYWFSTTSFQRQCLLAPLFNHKGFF